MNRLTLEFSDKTELLHFLENIAHAQHFIADKAETDRADSETLFSLMALSTIQKQALSQLAVEHMESERKTV